MGGTGSICAIKVADLLPGRKVIVIEKARDRYAQAHQQVQGT
jgi:hypothetical protein